MSVRSARLSLIVLFNVESYLVRVRRRVRIILNRAMDEIFELHGDHLDMLSQVNVVNESLFETVANSLFDKEMTVINIGIFLAYCVALRKNHPWRRQFIDRKVFEVLTQKLKF